MAEMPDSNLEGDKWQVFAFGLGGETDLGTCVYQKIEVKPKTPFQSRIRVSEIFWRPRAALSGADAGWWLQFNGSKAEMNCSLGH
jgi:hypothetical protein